MNTFIYTLSEPETGVVRYVGKSTDPLCRFKKHLRDPDKNHRTCWIRSLLARGLKPVLTVEDEVDAAYWPMLEVAYIQFFQEQGCDLVNGNAGGEGSHNPTAETRAKMSAANSGVRSFWLGKNHSPETRVKISASKTGKHHSQEARTKMSAAKIGVNCYLFGKKHSPETRAKMSAAHKLRRENEKRRTTCVV